MAAHGLLKAGYSPIVCDSGPIPNPLAASHGMHRLIHPWSLQRDVNKAQAALQSLQMWKVLLQDIGYDGFVPTGILAVGEAGAALMAVVADAQELGPDEVGRLMPALDQAPPPRAIYFPQFGVLMAGAILEALTCELSRNGVSFRPCSPVASLHDGSGRVLFKDGSVMHCEAIVLAAGTGTRDILERSDIASKEDIEQWVFHAYRSYVLYVLNSVFSPLTAPNTAWASLGEGDLWGMPRIGSFPAKFGCGALTHRVDAIACTQEIKSRMIASYCKISDRFDVLRHGRLAWNEWTKINSSAYGIHSGRCLIVTSDNGEGFKYAPLAGQWATKQMSELLPLARRRTFLPSHLRI